MWEFLIARSRPGPFYFLLLRVIDVESRFFELDDNCEQEVSCDTSLVIGTYDMAIAIADEGISTETVRIDAKFKNDAWVAQENGDAVITALSGVTPVNPAATTIAIDLGTKEVLTVAPTARFPIVCGCEAPFATTTPGEGMSTTSGEVSLCPSDAVAMPALGVPETCVAE